MLNKKQILFFLTPFFLIKKKTVNFFVTLFWIFLVLQNFPQLYADWGYFMHKKIHHGAVQYLPERSSIYDFFNQNEEFLIQWSISADDRRRKDPQENYKHFINLEAYPVANYYNDIPQNWDLALKKFGHSILKKAGILPWHIRVAYNELVQALKENKDAEKIIALAADLGHYVSDAHVPLHTTVNYDGQLSQQRGIHALWESVLPETFYATYVFSGKKKSAKELQIRNLEERIWSIIFDSHEQVTMVLLQERLATEKVGEDKKYKGKAKKDSKSKRKYQREFLEAYHQGLNQMVERQARKAMYNVASFWYSAWEEAGKPKLDRLVFEKKSEDLDGVK